MRDHPLVQLTLARMREFYREPEAIFWVFGFPIVLAFALGIAFRNRGPGELRIAVLRQAGDSGLAAALGHAPGLTVAVLDSAAARLQLRTGRVALLVVPGAPIVYRYDSTRTESRLARLQVDDAVQRARGIGAVSGLMSLVMLPMWILSGTFFSYARFPEAMQPFVRALPLTALNDALRAVMIDGSPLARLGTPLGIVTAWGVASFAVAL